MKYLAFSVALFFNLSSYSQSEVPTPCLTHTYEETLLNEEPDQLTKKAEIIERGRSSSNDRMHDVNVIPVVFHVVYNTLEQNLPDSVILDQLAILNRDFAHLNADTSFLRPVYNGIVGKADIEFQLAEFDPNGNPTTGITRTHTNTTTFGNYGVWTGDNSLVETMTHTQDGGEDAWDEIHYFNIWIGNVLFDYNGDIYPAFYGLAVFPWITNGPFNGILMHFEAVGSNNPNPAMYPDGSGGYFQWNIQGRTMVHEAGHYLGVPHIYDGNGGCFGGDDGIDDTPRVSGFNGSTCNVGQNTCVDTHPTWGDMPDMIENYMEYSDESCQVSFTLDQIAVMRGVLNNEREELAHNNGNPVSTSEHLEIDQISIYPNPAKDLIVVDMGSVIASEIQVYDNTGREVLSVAINNSKETILLTDLPSGVYYLNFVAKNSSIPHIPKVFLKL